METNKTSPQVTVLMTVYNGGQYLRRSVQSILDQTHRNFEFLIVDDTSTDNSLEVIKSFGDDRIHVHLNEENIGQAKSLNVGLKLAKGKYVARIDADDIAFPKWLEEQYSFIENNSSYAVVSTKAVVIDEHDKVRRIYDSPSSQEDIILRAFTFSPINHVGCIFNKQVVLDNDGYVEQYKIAADYGLWSKLLRGNHRITSTTKVLVAIRAHSSSFSQAESGVQELGDLSDIMRTNINAFTECQITPAESLLICKAFFDEGSLNDSEFKQAINVLKKAYSSLLPSLEINRKSAQRWSGNRCQAAYLKRIYSAIQRKNYALVKNTSRRGIKEFGFFSPMSIFLIAYFLGKIFLDYLPVLYEVRMKMKTYFVAKGKLKMAGLLWTI